jgi:hypothetical protein
MAKVGLLVAVLVIAAACAAPAVPTPSSTPPPTSSTPPTPTASPSPTLSSTPTATTGGQVFGQADFTRSGGCGDAFVYATNGADSMSVTVDWRGAASTAWTGGGFDGTRQIPDGELDVTLNVGRLLSQLYCTDIMTQEPRVDGTAHAIGGEVEISVTPDAGGFQPQSHADVTLRDVVFEVIQGSEVQHWRIDELVLQDVSVGWFAG